MEPARLFMFLIGCVPEGRHTEQHDIFFGIGTSVKELIPDLIAFWPEAKGKLHLDAWREVTLVDGSEVKVLEKGAEEIQPATDHLFFINLGGYKENEMEEYHYKVVTTGNNKNEALRKAKATAFFKHTGFEGATSHIDDKYGIDVDDMALIEEILPAAMRAKYTIRLQPAAADKQADTLHLGYFKLTDFL